MFDAEFKYILVNDKKYDTFFILLLLKYSENVFMLMSNKHNVYTIMPNEEPSI